MKSRLVLVEGIPGSGKTTTARFVRDWLVGQGATPHLYLEGDANHPADVDGMAYLDPDQQQRFLARNAGFESLLAHNAEGIAGGLLIPYLRGGGDKGQPLTEDLYDGLRQHDAYASLPADRLAALLVDRWRAFADRAAAVDGIFVFECCFLQNPATVLLGQHNCAAAAVEAHLLETARSLTDLQPILFYLHCGSVRETLNRAVEARPRAWIDFVTQYITGQGYGQAHGLKGMEGVVHFYEMLQALQERVVARLDWDKVVLDVPDGTWEEHHRQIASALSHGQWGAAGGR